MKKHFTLSNIVFAIVILIFLYKPSRIWMIRKMSLSPSLEKIEKNKLISNYNWELKGLNTTDVNFSAFKGKVVFLNFWATWCPPCVAELPYIQSFYNDYKNKVVFISLSNEKWSEINSFFKQNKYDFPVYQNKNTTLKDLPTVSSIPRTFIIDKKGNIRIDKTGAADWNSASFREEIDKMLN